MSSGRLCSAAVLTIKDAPDISDEGVKRICAWLDKQKKTLRLERNNLSKRFTARYLYVPEE